MADSTPDTNEQGQVTTADRRESGTFQYAEGASRVWSTLSGPDGFTVSDTDSDTFDYIIVRGGAGNADQNYADGHGDLYRLDPVLEQSGLNVVLKQGTGYRGATDLAITSKSGSFTQAEVDQILQSVQFSSNSSEGFEGSPRELQFFVRDTGDASGNPAKWSVPLQVTVDVSPSDATPTSNDQAIVETESGAQTANASYAEGASRVWSTLSGPDGFTVSDTDSDTFDYIIVRGGAGNADQNYADGHGDLYRLDPVLEQSGLNVVLKQGTGYRGATDLAITSKSGSFTQADVDQILQSVQFSSNSSEGFEGSPRELQFFVRDTGDASGNPAKWSVPLQVTVDVSPSDATPTSNDQAIVETESGAQTANASYAEGASRVWSTLSGPDGFTVSDTDSDTFDYIIVRGGAGNADQNYADGHGDLYRLDPVLEQSGLNVVLKQGTGYRGATDLAITSKSGSFTQAEVDQILQSVQFSSNSSEGFEGSPRELQFFVRDTGDASGNPAKWSVPLQVTVDVSPSDATPTSNDQAIVETESGAQTANASYAEGASRVWSTLSGPDGFTVSDTDSDTFDYIIVRGGAGNADQNYADGHGDLYRLDPVLEQSGLNVVLKQGTGYRGATDLAITSKSGSFTQAEVDQILQSVQFSSNSSEGFEGSPRELQFFVRDTGDASGNPAKWSVPLQVTVDVSPSDATPTSNDQAIVETESGAQTANASYAEGASRVWSTLSGPDGFTVSDTDSDTFDYIIVRGGAGNADQNYADGHGDLYRLDPVLEQSGLNVVLKQGTGYRGAMDLAITSKSGSFTQAEVDQILQSVQFSSNSSEGFEGSPRELQFFVRDTGDASGNPARWSAPLQVTVDVTPSNQAPENLTLSNAEVVENSTDVIGTLNATDPDGDPIIYRLKEGAGDNAAFEVVNGNQLKAKTGLDYESGSTRTVVIEADDGNGGVTEKTFPVTVSDANEAPEGVDLSGKSIAENSDVVIGTLTATDPDGDRVAFRLKSGASDNAEFELINGNQLKAISGLDFEAGASRAVVIEADDGANVAEQTFTITVTDVNEAQDQPVLSGDRVDENSAAVIGAVSATDPENQTLTYRLKANAANNAEFELVNGNQLKALSGLDFESGSTRTVVLEADDGANVTEQTFTITVNDVNEAPESIVLDGNSVAENSDAIIGTLNATDPDGDPISYRLKEGAGDNAAFEIVNGNQLKAKTGLDYESGSTRTVVIEADDGTVFTEHTFPISVIDVVEVPPEIEAGSFSQITHQSSLEALGGEVERTRFSGLGTQGQELAALDGGGFVIAWHEENFSGEKTWIKAATYDANGNQQWTDYISEPGDIRPYDLDLTALKGGGFVATWSRGVNDRSDGDIYARNFDADGIASDVYIVNTSGVGTYKDQSAPTVETFEDGSYIVVWAANNDDGNFARRFNGDGSPIDENEFRVSSEDFRDLAVFTLSDGSFLVVRPTAEVQQSDTTFHISGQFYDANGVVSGEEFRLAESTSYLSSPSLAELSDGSLVVGWQSGGNGSYDVTGQIFSKSGQSLSDAFTVNLDSSASINGPKVASLQDGGFLFTWMTRPPSVNGESQDAKVVAQRFNAQGRKIGAEFPLGDENSGSFYQTDPEVATLADGKLVASWFSLFENERGGKYAGVAQKMFEIETGANTVIDASLSITDPDSTSLASATVAVVAGYTEGDHLEFSIPEHVTGITGLFDASSGQLHFNGVASIEDYQSVLRSVAFGGEGTKASDVNREIVFVVDDGTVQSAPLSYTILVNVINEAPESIVLDGTSVAENSEAVIGALDASDPDGDPITYRLKEGAGNNDEFGLVDGNQLKALSGLDYESGASRTVVIEANDGANLVEQTFTITVTDVNEAPESMALDGDSVAENSDAVIGRLSATDPEGQVITYRLKDGVGDNAEFELINGNELKAITGLDYESSASRTVVIEADDGANVSEQTFTITVTDVNEAPESMVLDGDSVAENSDAVIGRLSATDPEGQSITYRLKDGVGDNSEFELINGNELKATTGLDYESGVSRTVVIEADDGANVSEQTFTIAVSDVNEAPESIVLDGDSVAENSDAVIGRLSATDPEGQIITYRLKDGVGDNAEFELVNGNELKATTGMDYETGATRTVVIEADDGTNVAEQTFMITVTDVNEAPESIALDGDSVAEQSDAVIGRLSAIDPEGQALTYRLKGGAGDNVEFELVNGKELKAVSGLDYESGSTRTVVIEADDGANVAEQAFTITVNDLAESAEIATSSSLQITHQSSLEALGGEVERTRFSGLGTQGQELAALDGGGFVIAWHEENFSGEKTWIKAATYDANGNQQWTDYISEPGDIRPYDLDLTALKGGGFVATWSRGVNDRSDGDIYARNFDADGIASDVYIVNTSGVGTYKDQSAPTVEAFEDGSYIVVWAANNDDGNFARRFNGDGSPIDENEFRVSSEDFRDLAVFTLSDGSFLVVRPTAEVQQSDTTFHISGQFYDANGVVSGEEFRLAESTSYLSSPSLAELSDGSLVVGWRSGGNGSYDVTGQIFSKSGQSLSDAFTVNLDSSASINGPKVASLQDGGFLFTWMTRPPSVNGESQDAKVVAQRFNAQGRKIGAEFPLGDENSGSFYQTDPEVATLADGKLVASWFSLFENERGGKYAGVAQKMFEIETGANTVIDASLSITDPDSTSLASATVAVVAGYTEGDHLEFSIPEHVTGITGLFDASSGQLHFNGVASIEDYQSVLRSVAFGGEGTKASDVNREIVFVVDDGTVQSAPLSYTILVNEGNAVPEAIVLDGTSVAENSDAVIGALDASDPDGDPITYRLKEGAGNNDEFGLVDGNQLKALSGLDYESGASRTVVIEANDGANLVEQTFTITVTDVNEAPESMALDGDSVAENSDAVIGRLSATDPEGQVITYRLKDGVGDNAEFELINGNELKATTGLDHESGASRTVVIEANDGANLVEQTFTITVSDVNEAPESIVLDGDSVAENSDAVIGRLSATDPEGQVITYRLKDGVGDNAAFELINGNELKAITGLDYESGVSRTVVIEADDGANVSEQTFTIAVSDVNEAPESMVLDGDSVAENSDAVIGRLSATDSEGQAITYRLKTDVGDNAEFELINGNELKAITGLDYESGASRTVVIEADDGANVSEQTFTIAVSDVNEAPESISLDGDSVTENSDAVIGRISATDPEGQAITYRLKDGVGDNAEFELSNGNELKAITGLDYESGATRTVIVQVDDGESVTERAFSITVINDPADDNPPEDGRPTITSSQSASPSYLAASYDHVAELRAGTEFQVNASESGSQNDVALTALNDGGFLATWVSAGSIVAQRYAADGSEAGIEFRVSNSASSQMAPDIAELADGGFIAVWQTTDTSTGGSAATVSATGIQAQRYTSDGSEVGAEFRVESLSDNAQTDPAVTSLAGGNYVVTWESYEDSSSSYKIKGQVFTTDGTKVGDEFYVNGLPNAQLDPEIAALDSGGFVAVWQTFNTTVDSSGGGISFQRFDADGSKAGVETQANTNELSRQGEPDVAVLLDGSFVVVWESRSAPGDDFEYGISGQRFSAAGAKLGSEFLVNTTTVDLQLNPAVTGLEEGGFVVTWDGTDEVSGIKEVYGQRYAADGTAVAGEFVISNPDAESDSDPAITSLLNGDFVVAWQGNDSSGTGVFARKYEFTDVSSNPTVVDGTLALTDTDSANLLGATVKIAQGFGAGDELAYIKPDGSRIFGEFDAATGELQLQGVATVADYQAALRSITFANETENPSTADRVIEFTVNDDKTISSPHQVTMTVESPVPEVNATPTITSSQSASPSYLAASYDHVAELRAGTEFQVNASESGSQNDVALTALNDGGFLATWVSAGSIVAQRYAADGSEAGIEFRVSNSASSQMAPDIAELADGGFIAVWQTTDTSTGGSAATVSATGIQAQRYTSDGSEVGAEFRVESLSDNAQTDPAVTSLAGGNYVVTWESYEDSSSSYKIKGQVFTTDGTKVGDEFYVNGLPNAQLDPEIAALDSGGFVAVWQTFNTTVDSSGGGISFQRFDADGSKAGVETQANTNELSRQGEPDVAVLLDGSFVVVWESRSAPGDDFEYGISGQRFSAAGAKLGSEFLVNTTTVDLQLNPAVTGLEEGGFVVTWDGTDEVSGIKEVYGQRYAADGTAVAGEFVISNPDAESDSDPAITSLLNGDFVVAWQGNDSSGTGVFARKYEFTDVSSNPTVVDGTLALTDTDSANLLGATVKIAQGFGAGDELAYIKPDGSRIFGEFDAATGELQLQGVATVADYQAALRSITFANETENPSTADRVIEFTVNDDKTISSPHQVTMTVESIPVEGTFRDDVLTGTASDDVIKGYDGNDILNGLAGNDALIGGAGGDILDGGTGDDVLTGGSGADHFVFHVDTTVQNETITDFHVEEGDVLDIHDLLPEGVTGDAATLDHYIHITAAEDGDTVVLLGNNMDYEGYGTGNPPPEIQHTIKLEGVTDLTQDHTVDDQTIIENLLNGGNLQVD